MNGVEEPSRKVGDHVEGTNVSAFKEPSPSSTNAEVSRSIG
jgi:hypothetical protein